MITTKRGKFILMSWLWVFGYGSLMWDGWEKKFSCRHRAPADLPGYRRSLSKKSTRNWGSREHPCPTLTLIRDPDATCRGIAFAFPQEKARAVKNYLQTREGKNFPLEEHTIHLQNGEDVSAFFPLYKGKNLLGENDPKKLADMILSAQGRSGHCHDYFKGLIKEFANLHIDDPEITKICHALGEST